MKIVTFNINNTNKRLVHLLDWLNEAAPDVVCMQELKASQREFPQAEIEKAGYGAVWRGEKSWNGVAILARGAEPMAELVGYGTTADAHHITSGPEGG